jgi:hypothetical protein
MKAKLTLVIISIMALSAMAQTNSPISIFVQVPSFTFKFPSTMTLGQMDSALKKLLGTNFTFTFTAMNEQTHKQVTFTGSSIPNTNELDQLFVLQKNNELVAAASETNRIGLSQSPVLTAFRKKYPQYADIPDSVVVLAIGKKFPVYLQQDKKFAEEFAKYSAIDSQNSVVNQGSDIEERKAEALERQADAQERQADALERTADAAEDQAFEQGMSDDNIDFRLDMLSLQNQSKPLTTFQPLPMAALPPVAQPAQPTFIFVPGQGTFVVSPEVPGQPQLITGPGLNGPIIISH